jgi:hypothetical protein
MGTMLIHSSHELTHSLIRSKKNNQFIIPAASH